jgi:hypothetical protein
MSTTSQTLAEQFDLPEPFVRTILNLAMPVRLALRGTLVSARTELQYQLATTINIDIAQYDTFAENLGTVYTAMETALAPIDKVINVIPVADIQKSSPEYAQKIMEVVGRYISMSLTELGAMTNLIGAGGLDLLEGDNDYISMRRKIRELGYRVQRQLALSTYAKAVKQKVDDDLVFLDTLIDFLDAI